VEFAAPRAEIASNSARGEEVSASEKEEAVAEEERRTQE
jgi:hypothetical protein